MLSRSDFIFTAVSRAMRARPITPSVAAAWTAARLRQTTEHAFSEATSARSRSHSAAAESPDLDGAAGVLGALYSRCSLRTAGETCGCRWCGTRLGSTWAGVRVRRVSGAVLRTRGRGGAYRLCRDADMWGRSGGWYRGLYSGRS